MSELGTAIKRMRKAKKLSIRELGDISHVSHPYISQIENGKFIASPAILLKLAKGLQCDYLFLLGLAGYEDDMKFRLEVRKLKCTYCDFIFLIEKQNGNEETSFSCPLCEDGEDVEDMGVIKVVEE